MRESRTRLLFGGLRGGLYEGDWATVRSPGRRRRAQPQQPPLHHQKPYALHYGRCGLCRGRRAQPQQPPLHRRRAQRQVESPHHNPYLLRHCTAGGSGCTAKAGRLRHVARERASRAAVRASRVSYITTRTTLSEVLIVGGTGFDVDAAHNTSGRSGRSCGTSISWTR